MFKKYSTLFLIVLLLNLGLNTSVFAYTTREPKAMELAHKIKKNIAKIGTGKDAQIEVKLKDKTKLKGYVSQINENSFALTDNITGVITEVPYPNAKQVKGNNLSTGVKIAIGVGIAIGVVVLICAISPGCPN